MNSATNTTPTRKDETMKQSAYRWQVRKELVKRCRIWNDHRAITATGLEVMLIDLAKSGSFLASEAKAALDETSDGQFDQLLKDVSP